MKVKMFPSHHQLDASVRLKSCTTLNQILADFSDLYSQVKYAHWNVRGTDFFALHKLFDTVAEPLPDFIDEIAERIGALGGVAYGTVRMAGANSRLPEMMEMVVTGDQFLRELCDRCSMVSQSLRMAITALDQAGDVVSSNMLQDMNQEIDKACYFLEGHLT